MENSLQISQSNLQAIIENTDASIYSLDKELCYITFNKVLERNLMDAYRLPIKPGDNVYSFLAKIAPEEADEWRAIYARALSGETVKFEKDFSGANFYSCISFSIYPIWESKNIIGLSCFAIDVTKQKQDIVQREKLIADITRRNKNLEQFSYVVSHNLRAPLANIIGLTTLLQTNEHDAEETFIIEGISSSVKKLDTVIHDLNHVLQVNYQVNENKKLVPFASLLADIQISISNLLQNEEVEITSDFSEVDEILTLKSYLYSIFFNLLSNSIKYRRPGIHPVIHISSAKQSDATRLIFKDNGLGIDLSQNADTIFGLYKRFHSHTEGKGIGLYLVKTQVEALGGTISVKSEINQGTTFSIRFPNT
jgi:signal transduction histidine kinase